MERQERNLAAEIVRGAFAAIFLPFTWAAGVPGAVVALVRRAAQPGGEPGQSARLERLNTGKWTRELLKHLEWRRLEELAAAYFEETGFRTGITHDRVDGGVDISLFAAGADTACMLVHCRAWDAYPIGIKPVRELHAAGRAREAQELIYVAAGEITQQARAFAEANAIRLVHGAELAALVRLKPA